MHTFWPYATPCARQALLIRWEERGASEECSEPRERSSIAHPLQRKQDKCGNHISSNLSKTNFFFCNPQYRLHCKFCVQGNSKLCILKQRWPSPSLTDLADVLHPTPPFFLLFFLSEISVRWKHCAFPIFTHPHPSTASAGTGDMSFSSFKSTCADTAVLHKAAFDGNSSGRLVHEGGVVSVPWGTSEKHFFAELPLQWTRYAQGTDAQPLISYGFIIMHGYDNE